MKTDLPIIPEKMRLLPQWVNYRIEERDGKRTKVPYNPATGERAKSNDPKTWSDFQTALSKINGRYNGIGFQAGIEPSGIILLDLDHCIVDGEIEPGARSIIATVRSYTEISPSGDGLHIFFGGKLPGPSIKTPKAEIYDHLRYFTVTGNADPEHNRPYRELPDEEIKTIYDLVASTRGDDPSAATCRKDKGTARVLPEHIEPGQRHPELFSVAGAMRRRGCKEPEIFAALCEVNKRCDTPLPEKELRKMATGVQRYKPATDFRPTETWAASFFVDLHGEDWRFDHTRGCWLHWNGKLWEADNKKSIFQMATGAAKEIRALIKAETDSDTAKSLLSYSLACENRHKISDVLEIASTLPEIAVSHTDLDSDIFTINCKNGTIDLRDNSFHEHHRSDLLTKSCNTDYIVGAVCPKWNDFLKWISCGDMNMVRHLQQFSGICLTGEPLQYLWFWYGLGANGKSVLWNTLSDLLGDYSLRAPFDMLSRSTGGIPNDIARLVGSRLVVCSEIPGGAALNEALVKELTGGDRLTARFLRCEYFEFQPTHKLVIVGNHRPRIRGADSGIWRRLLLIPFENVVPEGQRRAMQEMIEEFRQEYSGILNWALEGLADYRKKGLHIFDQARIARAEYRDSEDVLCEFLSGIQREPNATALGKDLYTRYQTTVTGHSMTQRAFYESLRERGYSAHKTMKGMVFDGLMIPEGGF